jgi:phage-related minor tail protein
MLGISISVARDAAGKRDEFEKKVDNNKKDAEDKFVDKDVCKVLHRNLDKNIEEIKKKIDCVPEIKIGVDLLLKKNGLKGD